MTSIVSQKYISSSLRVRVSLLVLASAAFAFAQPQVDTPKPAVAPILKGMRPPSAAFQPLAPRAVVPTTSPATPAATPAPAAPVAGGASGVAAAAGGAKGTGTTVGADGKARADTTALPQFESGMEYEPRSPNYRVSFSLEDADLPELVRVISQLTGKRFIFGGKVRSVKATVYSPQKVTVAEAYQAFLSILETNGLTVVPEGRFLKIVETPGIQSQPTPTYGPGQAVPAEERYVTRMHRLSHISSDEAAAVLKTFKTKDGDIISYGAGNMLIITDTGVNIRRLMTILHQIDVGSAGDQVWIEPIHYASATDIASRVNELFDVKAGAAKSAAPAAAGAVGGSAPAGDLHVAKILPDDRSNSIVIVATERAYLRMLELIRRLDVPQTGEGEIHVLSLQHADATELAKTLSDITGGAAGGAKPGGPPGAAGAPAGVFEGAIKITADKSTNSLVVTSSLRDYASLRSVVDKLDQSRRQVFIDAVIMDLDVKRTDKLGVSWHGGDTFQAQSPGDSLLFGGLNAQKTIGLPTDALQEAALGIRGPAIPGTSNLIPGIGLSIPAFGAVISAFTTSGDSDVLSTPHILALDNEPAEISIGQNIARQQNTGLGALGGLGGLAGGAGGAAGGLGALGALGGLGGGTPQFQDVGTKIKITPHLNESNEARLDITEEISDVGAAEGSLGVVSINKRTATTKLVVKDQETVVIGGLVRTSRSLSEKKIPLLGDIPVLGALFRTSEKATRKSNLILILTPYIIRDQSDLRNVFERKMQERQELLDRYFLFSDSEYKAPKDYRRTNGLLEVIRQEYMKVAERQQLEDFKRPKELKGHPPQQPLDMPAAARGTLAPAAPGADVKPGITVTPPGRTIEKVER
jgi:general secretion pathway protein D